MTDSNQLQWLYDRYVHNDLNAEELKLFLKLVHQSENEFMLHRLMEQTWTESEIENTLSNAKETVAPVRRKQRYLFNWKMTAAAACITAIGLTVYFAKTNRQAGNTLLAKTQKTWTPEQMPIVPGTEKATLVLEDGTAITLDSAKEGILLNKNGASITKQNDGQINYTTTSQDPVVQYHTMITPRGGGYALTLADGTKVWLNAASSIKFPNKFTGKIREVELKGEAYLEVAKNKNIPFFVKVNDIQVQVLGTSFNIQAYDDENTISTTLIEGSVKVIRGANNALLTPGQQVLIERHSGDPLKIQQANTDQAIAWKNGVFRFRDTDIRTIMREASRWYDVEVEYASDIHQRFTGIISRNSTIADFLQFLQRTEAIHFTLKGKKIIVEP